MWCERVSSLRESLLHNTDKSFDCETHKDGGYWFSCGLPKGKGQDFYLRSFRRGMIQKSMFDHESTASVCVVRI